MPETILVIDDEATIVNALALRLRAAGYEVLAAGDGPAGLAAARARRPDVVLLDVRMPGMDGFAVNAALRSDPALATIPVIFLSAHAQETARQRALEAGGAAFLPKPYEITAVLGTIERLLADRPAAVKLKETTP